MVRRVYLSLSTRLKFFFYTARRLFEVFFMMLLMHLWPEETYRFSTRKCLPHKKIRPKKNDNVSVPFELNKERTNFTDRLTQINLVMKGESFDFGNLKNLDYPVYLTAFYGPVAGVKDLPYVTVDSEQAKKFLDLGLAVIYVEVCGIDKKGRLLFYDGNFKTPWYNQLPGRDSCRRISVIERIYLPRESSSPYWAPTGSGLPAICALSHFAEKINVYGWDFYLKSCPDEMNYWQLYRNLYRFRLDFRSRNHFESAVINLYYGYHLSKMPNINVYGYLGRLKRHEGLIRKIERALFA